MKNWINRTHIAMVLNWKRGWNRPMKVNVKTFRLFNDLTDENMKLCFAPAQMRLEKRRNIYYF